MKSGSLHGPATPPNHVARAAPRIELPETDLGRIESGSAEFWWRPACNAFANKMVYNHRSGPEFARVVLISEDNQWKGLGTSNKRASPGWNSDGRELFRKSIEKNKLHYRILRLVIALRPSDAHKDA